MPRVKEKHCAYQAGYFAYLVLLIFGCSQDHGSGIEDPELERVVKAWPSLPDEVKEAILDVADNPERIAEAKQAAIQTQLSNNLRQAGLGLVIHDEAKNQFPQVDGANLSWRVHILPFVEHEALYREFNLDEPWDSEHNRKLIARMPEFFNSPGTENNGKTAIHVFVGRDAPFGGKKTTRMDTISYGDGAAHTILAVHGGPETEIEWTKPGGLQFEPDRNPFDLLGKISPWGIPVCFFDTHVEFLSPDISPSNLKWLIQHNDGHHVENR